MPTTINISTIAEVINRINSDSENGIFLPYIQRDFVWEEERIYSLFDSLMRGYPIGLIQVWETNTSINYRNFEDEYKSPEYNRLNNYPDEDNVFLVSDGNAKRQYVLDGQQRLQSLYIAMHGSYDDNILFFNLKSNAKDGYKFEFKPNTFKGNNWINIHDFLKNAFNPEEYNDEDARRNAQILYNIFNVDNNIPIQKIDGTMPLSDVAEIFVRTNSEGVVLEHEDLIMAFINGTWVEQPKEFTQLRQLIKDFGYTKPKEFITQACYAALLKETGESAAVKKRFDVPSIKTSLSESIREISLSMVDVLSFASQLGIIRECSIRQHNPLFVLIAYRYAHGSKVWNENKDALRAFVLISLLCKDFVRPSQKIIKDLLKHVTENRNFDLSRIQKIFSRHKKHFEFNSTLLLDRKVSMRSSLAPLILYLIYYLQPGFDEGVMTVKDHIFPQSELQNHRDNNGNIAYNAQDWDSILNCELLDKTTNSMEYKGNLLPCRFFTTNNRQCFNSSEKINEFMMLHAIPERIDAKGNDIWDINNYKKFLEARRGLLEKRIRDNFKSFINNNNNALSPSVKKFIEDLSKSESNSTSLTLDD